MDINKMDVVAVTIGESVWSMLRHAAYVAIQIAKDKYKAERVNAIVALEKGNTIEMRKDVFTDRIKMLSEKNKWKRKGFKVHFVEVK